MDTLHLESVLYNMAAGFVSTPGPGPGGAASANTKVAGGVADSAICLNLFTLKNVVRFSSVCVLIRIPCHIYDSSGVVYSILGHY